MLSSYYSYSKTWWQDLLNYMNSHSTIAQVLNLKNKSLKCLTTCDHEIKYGTAECFISDSKCLECVKFVQDILVNGPEYPGDILEYLYEKTCSWIKYYIHHYFQEYDFTIISFEFDLQYVLDSSSRYLEIGEIVFNFELKFKEVNDKLAKKYESLQKSIKQYLTKKFY